MLRAPSPPIRVKWTSPRLSRFFTSRFNAYMSLMASDSAVRMLLPMEMSRLKFIGSLHERPAVWRRYQALDSVESRSISKPIPVRWLSVRWKKPLLVSRKLNSAEE
ncbi:hypothetical protein D3C73_1006490 [compost metagenome]